MLSHNIKSSSYMCLDIDPDSVIHKHIVKKLTNESWGSYTTLEKVEKWRLPSPSSKSEDAYHSLTMLPSFHISLEAPNPKYDLVGGSITVPLNWFDIRAFIGEIILADIHISEKNNKKSAWIALHPDLIDDFMPHHHNHRHYDRPNNPDADLLLHISLANLTGNPHDSIARPEDCIIDTITA